MAPDPFSNRSQLVSRAGDDKNDRSLGCEFCRDLFANALRGIGDDDMFPAQLHRKDLSTASFGLSVTERTGGANSVQQA